MLFHHSNANIHQFEVVAEPRVVQGSPTNKFRIKDAPSDVKVAPAKTGDGTVADDADNAFDDEDKADKDVKTAGEALAKFLDPEKCCSDVPLLVICFDEAHRLTDKIPGVSWTCFSELRRALRVLKPFPFFSLFLSTAGKFHLFSPDYYYDASNRIQHQILDMFPPITETNFDQFAEKVAVDGSWTLDRVASTHHMAHLGRPL